MGSPTKETLATKFQELLAGRGDARITEPIMDEKGDKKQILFPVLIKLKNKDTNLDDVFESLREAGYVVVDIGKHEQDLGKNFMLVIWPLEQQ